jgi:hypothetical protein
MKVLRMQTNPIRQTQNRRTQNAEQIAAVPGTGPQPHYT